ncbi:MAG: GGDEF domain-containing protein [Candidatus Brocadiia bacterium]|nr:GGDEF domain-containing protein [Candidatus Brocadiia bacterium]
MGSMVQSTNWLSEKVDPKRDLAESKLRGIFLASLVLCALIGGHLMFLTDYSADSRTVVRVALLPIMLWAFAVTGYSFHSLWCVAGKRKAKLQEIVRRDSQTGAYTDTYLFEGLDQERERAINDGVSAEVGFVRVCGVEDVNHAYGHAAGNLVLKELVQLMNDIVPPGGMVARLGGQEFVVLLPQTSPQEGEGVLKDIRDRVRKYTLDLGKRGTITGMEAGVGVAAYPSDGESPADIVRAAQDRVIVDLPAGLPT